MKAWQFSSIIDGSLAKSITLNNDVAPPPAPGKNQVAVDVIAMSLNPVDHKIFEIPLVGKLIVKTPASPGLDYSGRVTSVGAGVTDLKPGDLCFGRLDKAQQFGTMAQKTIAPLVGAAPLPKGVNPDDAACVGTAGLTAYQTIVPNVKSGDEVFINGGSGGTGTWGIQIAKSLGCHVTTTCSTRNIGFCKELGADEVLDYTKESIIKTLSDKGPRFALCIDNVGGPDELYAHSHEFLLPKGKFVQVGAIPSFSGAISIASRMFRPSILGGGKRSYQLVLSESRRPEYVEIGKLMQERKIKAIIEEKYKFEDGIKAVEKIKSGRTVGKVVVQVAES